MPTIFIITSPIFNAAPDISSIFPIMLPKTIIIPTFAKAYPKPFPINADTSVIESVSLFGGIYKVKAKNIATKIIAIKGLT